MLAAQDGPPCSGKFNGYIARLWTDVRRCPRLKWVIRVGVAGSRRPPVYPG
jgi:hypothetical protein